MIRQIATYAMFFALLGVPGCGQEPIASHWVDAPPVIDGDGADWPMAHMTYVEKTRGVIGVANDDSMIYLLFRFRDPNTARKAMAGGATVWWSREGKNARESGIRFFPTISVRDLLPGRTPNDRPPDAESEEDSDASSTQTPPKGFGDRPKPADGRPGWVPGQGFGRPTLPTPEEGILHTDVRLVTAKDPVGVFEFETLGIRAQSTYRKGTYAYELAVPRGSARELGITAPDGKARFVVVVGGVAEEDRDFVKQAGASRQRPARRPEGEEDGRDGGAGPGGRGGGGPGRGTSGGRGGMPNPFQDLLETIEASFTIVPATHPE